MIRKTTETDIEITESDYLEINTKDKIFDHMLKTMFFYMEFPIKLNVFSYDLRHHLWEDTGIIIGKFLSEKIKNIKIKRFSSVILPMDDALILNSIDISRIYTKIDLNIQNSENGFEESLFKEFVYSLSRNIPATIHIKQINGENAHHIIECCFKTLGINLKECIKENNFVNSTKGMI